MASSTKLGIIGIVIGFVITFGVVLVINAQPPRNIVLELPGKVHLEMVKIKAGSFMMGSPEGELGRSNNEKQHCVTLTKDFWLGKYEVTQRQWEAVMGNNPSYFWFGGENRPVELVSWNDAMKFCEKLNKMGKAPAGYMFTLPTEAQWEYACRAGTKTSLNSDENMIIEGENNKLDFIILSFVLFVKGGQNKCWRGTIRKGW